MTKPSEEQSQTEQSETTAPSRKSSRKSVVALAVVAIGINTTAAVYTLSPSDFPLPHASDFALPSFSSLAELLPQQKASDPIPAVAASKDFESAQQQHFAALQENNSLLQQNTALLHQDSISLASLRQSVGDQHVDVKKISAQIADEHQDVKKISGQISTLIAKLELAATCDSAGNNFLHSSKARWQPAIPCNAQKVGSAAQTCRSRFAWRSALECPG